MDIKKLKTSELLDQVEEKDIDDSLFDDSVEELYERIPFACDLERFEELEKRYEELEKEIEDLKETLRIHAHLDGKVVVKVQGTAE